VKDHKPRRAVFYKLILSAVLTASSGLGMLHIYSLGLWWPSPEVLRYTCLAGLGLTGGLFARVILGKHTGLFRFLAALFSVVVGLWGMDWITQGYIGIQVIDLDHPYPDYASLIELGVPWLVAGMTVLAWRKRRQSVPAMHPEPMPKPALAPLPASTDVKPVPLHLVEIKRNRVDISAFFTSAVEAIKNWANNVRVNPVNTTLAHGIATEPRSFSQVTSGPLIIQPSPSPKISHVRPVKTYLANFGVVEEHLCPYCLENVDLNDQRGVKVCHICGTYHHSDCWDVTGSCRAPHHQRK